MWKFFKSDGSEKKTYSGIIVPNLLTLVYDNRLAADTAGTTAWDFSGIPGNPGDDLIISADLRASAIITTSIRFNNDSGATYRRQVFESGVYQSDSADTTQIYLMHMSQAEDDTTANFSSFWEIVIRNYAGTDFFKNISWRGGGSGRPQLINGFGIWKSLAAINRFAIMGTSGVFKAGSRLTIWRRTVA